VPTRCTGVPDTILQPEKAWPDAAAYRAAAKQLAEQFVRNFTQYAEEASDETLAAGPKVDG
jgi:phosphoenolpyruvate carboxykinase (ATP)